MRVTRRAILHTGAAALAAPALGALALPSTLCAQERAWKHGLSLFGDLKYPEGFKQFDYVNAGAPKGGVVRMIAFGTFDNFNGVVAGVKGTIATGIDEIYDRLMTPAMDEVSAEYGLLAEAVSHRSPPTTCCFRSTPSRRIIRSTRPTIATS